MRILLIYHFFHPDTVISARLFADLASDLRDGGHQVTVFTGNRLLRGEGELPEREDWNGVEICRFRRPNFRQGSHFGRLLNSFILQLKWLCGLWRRRADFDAIIIGTDPQFTYLMFPWIRLICGKVRLIHWVFDLYPEIILVNSSRWMRWLASLSKPLLPLAYRTIDRIIDIGPRMRQIMQRHNQDACGHTITPWALSEPSEVSVPDSTVRKELFGEAKLAILYSGTVGHAHNIIPFIELARECRRREIDVAFCFAGYGNTYHEQLSVLSSEDTNIRMAGFADESQLEQRLAAADIHLISLREGWEGLVVPSKFFAALAIGRPVLFHGSEKSDIAQWIREFSLGNVLAAANQEEVIGQLCAYLNDLGKLRQDQRHAWDIYQAYFSKRRMLEKFQWVISGT